MERDIEHNTRGDNSMSSLVQEIALAILGLSAVYLVGEINSIQADIKQMTIDIAILKERANTRRRDDNSAIANSEN